MAKFLIAYTDPETGRPAREECEFRDWNGAVGGKHTIITAREWAEDLAYSLADKGAYTITDIKD